MLDERRVFSKLGVLCFSIFGAMDRAETTTEDI